MISSRRRSAGVDEQTCPPLSLQGMRMRLDCYKPCDQAARVRLSLSTALKAPPICRDGSSAQSF